MFASEAVPFAKTGGLADVTGALSIALGALGHEVTLVLPLYRSVGWIGAPFERGHVSLGDRWYDVGYVERRLGPGARAVLVECDELFDRDGLYGVDGHDHPDNAIRFGLLARAALHLALKAPRSPNVLHAHDWQAGLVPIYARTVYGRHPRFARLVTVFTIHNIAYQGVFPASARADLDLGDDVFTVDGLEFWNQVSFLKAGINGSDFVTTVSEGYAREILTPEYGYGFEGIMQARRSSLCGILNGIDPAVWDPAHDKFLPAPFSVDDLSGKVEAKRRLLERFGLPVTEASLQTPVVGMISRLVYQKGFDLIAEVIDELASLGATFVVLGSGEAEYERMWQEAAARHRGTIGVTIGYDDGLAHLIEGGADLFLMPSRYEPCGLNQMYSMRYGTVPVVRATGGLDDAVDAYNPQSGAGTGFKFTAYESGAMLEALRSALAVHGDPERWRAIQRAGMRRDHSWTASAQAYVKRYAALIERRRNDDA